MKEAESKTLVDDTVQQTADRDQQQRQVERRTPERFAGHNSPNHKQVVADPQQEAEDYDDDRGHREHYVFHDHFQSSISAVDKGCPPVHLDLKQE